MYPVLYNLTGQLYGQLLIILVRDVLGTDFYTIYNLLTTLI